MDDSNGLALLTRKVRHGSDLARELGLARQVAEIAVAHKGQWLSTKDVKR